MSTLDFPRFANDGVSTPPDHCQTSYNYNPSRGYLSPFPRHSNARPNIKLKPYDDKSYGSSTRQHPRNNVSFLPMPVPLFPYYCGNKQRDWVREKPIHFFQDGFPGVKLVDALDGKFTWMDGRDDFPFSERCSGITIRIYFPGYPSSTGLERKLKNLAKFVASGEKHSARSMQVSAKHYRNPRGPVTRSKILQEVCKRIDWHIKDLLQYADFDESVGEEWRLLEGAKERMTILRLENVSKGSWSPIIVVDRPCLPSSVPSTSA